MVIIGPLYLPRRNSNHLDVYRSCIIISIIRLIIKYDFIEIHLVGDTNVTNIFYFYINLVKFKKV
jgi:hypothetical protein